MQVVTIYTDGGSRGNPGPAGIGVHVVDHIGQTLHEDHQFIGEATNNEAEYQAVQVALEWLIKPKTVQQFVEQEIKTIQWKLDSKLVVEQLNKNWKIKEPRMKVYAEKIWEQLQHLEKAGFSWQFGHIPRNENAAADALVNQALDAALA